MNMSLERPLFVPLRTEFYLAFAEGRKTSELRRYGARWNERTCRVGRRVVLSHGYHSPRHPRLHGVVIGFEKTPAATLSPAEQALLVRLFGAVALQSDVARIVIALDTGGVA
jgi:hypothetical protein